MPLATILILFVFFINFSVFNMKFTFYPINIDKRIFFLYVKFQNFIFI